jgi:hypothetical protein
VLPLSWMERSVSDRSASCPGEIDSLIYLLTRDACRVRLPTSTATASLSLYVTLQYIALRKLRLESVKAGRRRFEAIHRAETRCRRDSTYVDNRADDLSRAIESAKKIKTSHPKAPVTAQHSILHGILRPTGAKQAVADKK